MLEGIATGYTMLPQDWKDLMRMLLSPAQYVVFESEFKHSASALSDPQHTASQLYGAGQYDNIPAQATLTPVHFSRTATCVQRAFRKVPVSGQPLSSFVNIKQQHSEPYHQFIDRLKESVTRQIDNTTAQNELMKKLAFENANTDCKKALQSIIHRPKYDLADMIQACADVSSQSHAMSLLAGAIQATNRPTGQLESFPPLVSAAENFSKNTPSEFAIDLINQETKDSVLPGEIVLMPTQLAGPLPPKVAGLILPKFSAAKEGIQVIPGVLDPDYVGTIMVQLWSHMPMQLKKGESWAHLVVLPSHPTASIMDSNLHELSSFPPQLLAVVQRIGEKKLLRKYKINGIVLEGLIDTGADVSVISSNCWDPTWPLESASAVWGVGGPQTSSKSVQWLPVSLPDSSETIAYIQPCVLKIHLNLWGRDLLQQLQATIQFNE
ncbi:retrovirus group K member 113 Gag polyproteinpolyprotein-like-like, partial [Podarcis lilfordi]